MTVYKYVAQHSGYLQNHPNEKWSHTRCGLFQAEPLAKQNNNSVKSNHRNSRGIQSIAIDDRKSNLSVDKIS